MNRHRKESQKTINRNRDTDRRFETGLYISQRGCVSLKLYSNIHHGKEELRNEKEYYNSAYRSRPYKIITGGCNDD